jgi:hypothetical protein
MMKLKAEQNKNTKFLFVTLPSNDLGLLMQSLPIARELSDWGYRVSFCSPGKAPRKLISDAGFNNLLPKWPLYSILSGNTGIINYYGLLFSKHFRRDLGILDSFVKHLKKSATSKIWNIDHFNYIFGMSDENYIRANIEALINLIKEFKPDVIVDFWNPYICIAARICHKPLISVLQADIHPQSQGFIWWEEPPPEIPTPVPVINTVLAEYGLQPVEHTGELLVGDLNLVVGMPGTDPLPGTANINYIGPVLWQKQKEKLPDWFNDLHQNGPVIWLYPGNPRNIPGFDSPFDSVVVLYAGIRVLKDMPVQVILSTGNQPLPKDILPLPPNFRYVSFVPALAMAERSDLMIHHGGYGSCQAGLFCGTPAIIIPTFSERESNARRITAMGAGDFVLPETDAS